MCGYPSYDLFNAQEELCRIVPMYSYTYIMSVTISTMEVNLQQTVQRRETTIDKKVNINDV